MADFGPFSREKSPTQTDAVAIIQKKSGEIWGLTPVGKGYTPTVEAYPGKLAPPTRGIEFNTPVEPFRRSAPHHAKWYYGETIGVELREKDNKEYACIPATVTVLQP